MFAISDYQQACIALRKAAREVLRDIVGEYGKILFVDGDGNPMIDIAVGPSDKETGVYPDVNFVGKNDDGKIIVNTTDACECEDRDFSLDDTDISTDDLCNLADNASLIINCEFEVECDGTPIGRQNYKALLLLDIISEHVVWRVTKIYKPGE